MDVLDVLAVHVLRTTHNAAHLHPIAGVLLHLVLILLLLLLKSHVHHRVWIVIFSVLFRLECKHSVISVLEILADRLSTNLCLIVPVLIQHRIPALSTCYHVPLPVLTTLEVLRIRIAASH